MVPLEIHVKRRSVHNQTIETDIKSQIDTARTIQACEEFTRKVMRRAE